MINQKLNHRVETENNLYINGFKKALDVVLSNVAHIITKKLSTP